MPISDLFCKKCCCCCYSDSKNVNPVTLTRAETITVQPTTSAAMQMSTLVKEERLKRAKSKDGESAVSEFDEIDLEERLPTDSDLQAAAHTTQRDQHFAAAVTDMMLDEIHEDATEKEEKVVVEPIHRIDSNAVIEATDEEVMNTLTRKIKEEKVDAVVGVRPVQHVSEGLDTPPSPPKPPRQTVVQKVEPENAAESELKPADDGAYALIRKDDRLIHHVPEDSLISVGSAKVCELDDEATEDRKILAVTNEAVILDSDPELERQEEIDEKDISVYESLKNNDELSNAEAKIRQENNSPFEMLERDDEIVQKPLKHHPDEAVDDETTASTDFEMKHANVQQREQEMEELSADTPPPLPKNPPPASVDLIINRPTMYGNLTDSSDESELESESLSVPRKKPNRVSVKQTNVVITKVTAMDAPNVEEISDLESLAVIETNKPRGYVVLTDDEFSEKII